MKQIVAAIDIGTNTILMTIAEGSSSKDYKVLDDFHSIARLGENVDKTKMISPEAMDRAAIILSEYRRRLDEFNPSKVVAVCTSAMRDAKNNLAILNRIKQIIKGEARIIDGLTEANMSFHGTVEDDSDAIVIDIGGGSTEIILGSNRKVNYRISTNLGAVRLTEKFTSGYPVTKLEQEVLNNIILQETREIPFGDFRGKVYAVAGTATTLAAMDLDITEFDRATIHHHLLYPHKIESLSDMLLSSTTDYIVDRYLIPRKRADVLPAGALILSSIVKALNNTDVIVSTEGLRYGLLKQILDGTF